MSMLRPQPNAALREMLERDGELVLIMERGLVFDRPAPAPREDGTFNAT